MAEVEHEEAIAVVYARVDGVVHFGRLATFFPSGAVAYVRSCAEADVAFQQVASLLAKSLHGPFARAVYLVYGRVSSEENKVQMVGIPIVFIFG